MSAIAFEAPVSDWASERLEAEIELLAAHLAAAESRWLELLGEFDRRQGWASWGCASAAHWLNWRCGTSLPAARERVRVSRRLPGLPLIADAFSRGRLSYSKVRAISRAATSANEELFLNMASSMTASQLERTVRSYRQATALEAEELCRKRFLSTYWADDGSLVIRGRLAPEDGATFLAAIGCGIDALRHDHRDKNVSAETPAETPEPYDSFGATQADALVAIAESILAHGLRPGSGSGCHELVVHVDADTLESADGRCHLEDGPGLSVDTARRLACGSSAVFLLEGRDGTVINTSPRSPVVPAALARAVKMRDGGCVFPGCSRRLWVDVHHIRFRSQKGRNSALNLGCLCRAHHRLVHEGQFTMSSVGEGQFVFTRPDGTEVTVSEERVVSTGDVAVRALNERRGVAMGPAWLVPDWDGSRPDYAFILDGLLDADGVLRT